MRVFGLILIAVLILLPLIWLPGIATGKDQLAMFSQYIGLVALIAMALGQIISTRWGIVETVFGALDQSYRIHKWLGIGALVAVLVHDTIDADINGLGRAGALEDMAETAGEISLYGLLIFVVITLATFIPYNLWKYTHRFIGTFFVLGAFHYIFILKPFATFDPLGIYMLVICTLGTIAYLYTSAPRGFRPYQLYKVASATPEGNALAIDMKPLGKPVKHRAGQFAFFSFVDAGMNEPHPFTISSAPREDGALRITVAPLGDFTTRLMNRVQQGQELRVEGPFGHFDRARKGHQVWIAAGVGITPFMALAEGLGDTTDPTTLIYCIRNRKDAAHLSAFEAIAKKTKGLELITWQSADRGRLGAAQIVELVGDDLKKSTVSFCGPSSMRKSLMKGLKPYGVTARRFRYENFEIRTGIGIKELADWLWRRRDRVLDKTA